MDITLKKVALADLDILVETRMEVLRTVYELDENTNISELEKETADYYAKSLVNGNHIAYLIFVGDVLAGTGGISFYRVMPTYDNPTGEKAFVMNMYTRQKFRRKGIASKTLEALLKDAKERGITHVGLEASDMGKAMYIKFGFALSEEELHLTLER